MAEHFEDQLTGEVYSTHDLDAQYRAYVADLTDELPGVQPCSFDHWLRGELEDRLRRVHPAPGTSERPASRHG